MDSPPSSGLASGTNYVYLLENASARDRDAEWYVITHGRQKGPVSYQTLVKMVLSGRPGGEFLVWREGFLDWIAGDDFVNLSFPQCEPELRVIEGGVGGDPDHFFTEPQTSQPERNHHKHACWAIALASLLSVTWLWITSTDRPKAMPQTPSAQQPLPTGPVFEPIAPVVVPSAPTITAPTPRPKAKRRIKKAKGPRRRASRPVKWPVVSMEKTEEARPTHRTKGLTVLQTLTDRHIAEVVDRNKRRTLRDCLNQSAGSLPSGRWTFRMHIGASGRVIRAAPTKTVIAGSSAASCIARRMKRWRFPAIAEGSTRIEVAVAPANGLLFWKRP